MKNLFCLLAILLLLTCACSGATEIKYGSLNIFSKVSGLKIYVDGEFKAKDSVQIKEIQAGTHFIKVTSGEATPEATVYAEVIEVKAGELTTLYVSEKGAESSRKASQEEVDVFKAKKVLDYSKEMHTGWYLKLGYLTNLYYSYDSPNLDRYASSLGIGLGFKVALAPNLDFNLEMERGEMNSGHNEWYFMPITANIQISFLPSQYFRGKQFYGLGIAYYMTNLESQYKQNLSAFGYHLFYGMEMPSGDKNAYFFEFGYYSADLSRYEYNMSGNYVSVGYRWDVQE